MALQDEGDNLKAMAAALHKESGTVEDAISSPDKRTPTVMAD